MEYSFINNDSREQSVFLWMLRPQIDEYTIFILDMENFL
jgi:hypothetical protein